MQREVGEAIGQEKAPLGEVRVDDLEAVRHPVDRRRHSASLMPAARRTCEAEHDLGLEPRLHEGRERHARLAAVDELERGVPDRAPDRRVHAVARPDAAVGEADLVADRAFAAGRAQGAELVGDAEGIAQRERGLAGADERQHLRRVVGREQCLGVAAHARSSDRPPM